MTSSDLRIVRLFSTVLALAPLTFGPGALAHSPHDDIQLFAISPQHGVDRTLFVSIQNLQSWFGRILKSTDGGDSWVELGNGLDNRSHLTALAISPTFDTDRTLFVGTAAEGLFRSSDGGSSWQRANESLENVGIKVIAMSENYASDKIVLAAGAHGGLYRSTDGGESWFVTLPAALVVSAIHSTRSTTGNVFWVGSDDGHILLSDDGGQTWKKREGPAESAVTSILCTRAEVAGCLVGTEEHGLYFTDDQGVTYVSRTTGLPRDEDGTPEPITDLASRIDEHSSATIFASTWNSALFRSSDGGDSWQGFSTGLTTHEQADEYGRPHFSRIGISKGAGDVAVYVAGFDGLFKSGDSGKTWAELETVATGRIESLAVSPDYPARPDLAAVTQYGGAYLSSDGGDTWSAINHGLSEVHVWDILFAPGKPETRELLATSNRAFYRSTVANPSWGRISLDRNIWTVRIGRRIGADWRLVRFPIQLVPSPAYPEQPVLYFGTRYEGLYRSTDAGDDWSQLDGVPEGWTSSLVISPSYKSDRTVFAAVTRLTDSSGVYRTRDGGRDWERLSGPFEPTLSTYKDVEIQLALSPGYAQDHTAFLGTAAGLYRSLDGGDQWHKATGEAAFEAGYIRALGVSPDFSVDATVLAAVKGKGVYVSQDGGRSFLPATADPEGRGYVFEKLLLSPGFAADRTVFGSANGHLLKSTDGAATWSTLPRLVRYEDENSVVKFTGNWTSAEHAAYSTSTVRKSVHAGDRATLQFVGTGVAWIGETSPGHGRADVYIDGSLAETVDLYAATMNSMVELFRISSLPHATHSISVEVNRESNRLSNGSSVSVDAFDVLP